MPPSRQGWLGLFGAVLPGGTVILAAAAYAKIGSLQWRVVVLLGWAGMVVGNCADYWVGRKAFRPLVRRLDKRRGIRAKLAHARVFLDGHGAWAVLAGHFLGHLRSFIAITAGSSQFPFRRYLLFEAVAALAWNVVYCGLGYLLASHLDLLRTVLERTGLGGLVVLALALWLSGGLGAAPARQLTLVANLAPFRRRTFADPTNRSTPPAFRLACQAARSLHESSPRAWRTCRNFTLKLIG